MREFVIAKGTPYSDEILIVKDDEAKKSPAQTVGGFHDMLTARTRMAPATFKGYLDNMARAAVVQLVKLSAGKSGSSQNKEWAMPQISTDTMLVAIQAVAAQMRDLREAVASGEAEPEEMLLLEEWQEAARDLERAYDAEAKLVLNLPPYGELTGEN